VTITTTTGNRQDRDRLKLLGYFAGRAGQWRTIAQTIAGTGLPIERAYQALDGLVADGLLVKENEHLTPTGTTIPAWVRHDPPAERAGW
jgi:hypothetical protein